MHLICLLLYFWEIDTDYFFLHLVAVIFISIYQMTPLPFSAAVKQPHLLQCALRYYDSAANVSCDAAIGWDPQQNNETCSALMADLSEVNQCV